MIDLILSSDFLKWAVGAVVAILGVLGYGWRQRAVGAARRDAMRDEQAAESKAKALETRWDIDNAIDQDVALAIRARKSGVVRHNEH